MAIADRKVCIFPTKTRLVGELIWTSGLFDQFATLSSQLSCLQEAIKDLEVDTSVGGSELAAATDAANRISLAVIDFSEKIQSAVGQ